MPQESLSKLKQFESILKQILISKFGKYMNKDKVSLLNATNYITKDVTKEIFENHKGRNDVQGIVLRNMLDSVINITVMKEFNVKDYGVISFMYGEQLEKGIIEYYAKQISEQYKFNINEIPELNGNLELATLLITKLGNEADKEIMTSDAVKLLGIDGLQEAAKNYTKNEVKQFVQKKKVEKKIDPTDEKELFNNKTSRIGSIQIVELDGKKHIKYIDLEGKVHLVEAYNSDKVTDFYKGKLANLKPGEELNPEEFFKELVKINEEIPLQKTEDIDFERTSFEPTSMIDYVHANENIRKEAKKESVTHDASGKIHVIESTNDIVVTDFKEDHVDAKKIKDGTNVTSQADNSEQENKDVSENVLSQSEYEELCMKFANNEQLTVEELRALRRSTPDLMSDEEKQAMIDNISINNSSEEYKGPSLVLGSKNAAFANKNMVLYVIAITVLVGIFLGALLFKIVN